MEKIARFLQKLELDWDKIKHNDQIKNEEITHGVTMTRHIVHC